MDTTITCECGSGDYDVENMWNHFKSVPHQQWQRMGNANERQLSTLIICTYCYKIMTWDRYNTHKKSHLKRGDIPVPTVCPYCGQLMSYSQYRKHLNDAHSDIEDPIIRPK